jgi:imidazolonepropionase-like amidohydrolase
MAERWRVPLQRRQATLFVGLPTTRSASVAGAELREWTAGNGYALPSPQIPKRRLSRYTDSCATLTIHLVHKIGQARLVLLDGKEWEMDNTLQRTSVVSRRRLLQTVGLGGGVLLAGPGASALAGSSDQAMTIKGVKVFDGRWLLEADTVIIEGSTIAAVGRGLLARGTVIDGAGATLLPGLIDSHTHTNVASLRDALLFGVTTELEMGGNWQPETRKQAAANDSIADFRTSYNGITAPGGHPAELMPPGRTGPSSSTPAEARKYVDSIVGGGADYIKILVEEGTVFGHPGLPQLSNAIIEEAVSAAHDHGRMAIAHALTLSTAERVVRAGVDGLAHIFIDKPHTEAIVQLIAQRQTFVTPCLTLNASIMGGNGKALADDPRVASKLSPTWRRSLSSGMDTWRKSSFQNVLRTVAALHKAGVDILAGTDASAPAPGLGGLAHGASLHDELQQLVRAGLTPVEALRAATSTPARRFDLRDRGRIAPGLRADLVLVAGDPTTNIADTLTIKKVWKHGSEVSGVAVA